MRRGLSPRPATFLVLTALVACGNGADRDAGWRERVGGPRSGASLYKQSCASCHGDNAQGAGPVAQFLTVKVPDLTRIAARRNGQFPDLEIFRIIDGQAPLEAHGPRHMPVWGYEFFGDDADDEVAHRQATEKVDRLVGYLRSIQRP